MIRKRLKLSENQELYFTFISYHDLIISESQKIMVDVIKKTPKVLVAGIAKPDSFFAFFDNKNDICLSFPDHHHFTDKDILKIKNLAQNKIIIATEKDYMRLRGILPSEQLFYLPIQSRFLSNSASSGDNFDKTILNYVGTSSRNR